MDMRTINFHVSIQLSYHTGCFKYGAQYYCQYIALNKFNKKCQLQITRENSNVSKEVGSEVGTPVYLICIHYEN